VSELGAFDRTNLASRGGRLVRESAHSKVAGMTEDEAIRLAQQGDAAAFERLYHLHNRRVYSLCLRMVGNPTEAEDLAQEAFLLLFRKIQTFRGDSAFTTWLHRLTVNIVLMRFRKKKPAESSFDEATEPDEESGTPGMEFGAPDLRLKGLIDRVTLQRAVDQLAPGYKMVFILHDIQGYEHNEIAEVLGCSLGNSKSQLHKARLRMREILKQSLGGGTRRRRGGSKRTAPATSPASDSWDIPIVLSKA
jgi:RNA polymerase sigma-70 factor (ECF subfamily)